MVPTAEEAVVAVGDIIIHPLALVVVLVLATVPLTIVVVATGIDLKTAITTPTPIEEHGDQGWVMSWEA